MSKYHEIHFSICFFINPIVRLFRKQPSLKEEDPQCLIRLMEHSLKAQAWLAALCKNIALAEGGMVGSASQKAGLIGFQDEKDESSYSS